jgi:hypothetical protein
MGASWLSRCERTTRVIIPAIMTIMTIMTMVTAVTVLDHWNRDINWIVIAFAFYFDDLRW